VQQDQDQVQQDQTKNQRRRMIARIHWVAMTQRVMKIGNFCFVFILFLLFLRLFKYYLKIQLKFEKFFLIFQNFTKLNCRQLI
jgi:hypothetical protein